VIKNMNLINDKIRNFSFENIEYIAGFCLKFQNRSIDDNCVLDIDFIFEEQGTQYSACFRFYKPNRINFECGGIYQQISIAVLDIRDRGWENKKFEVIDYEEDTVHFYCTDIEVISVSELN